MHIAQLGRSVPRDNSKNGDRDFSLFVFRADNPVARIDAFGLQAAMSPDLAATAGDRRGIDR